MICIGIDTGGTCTDAVIFDTEEKRVLSYGKSMTTKDRLEDGILSAIRKLEAGPLKKAECISLSTTLATNACVEGKGGRAKLIFIGVNPKAVSMMSGVYGLPPVEEIYFLKGNPLDGEKPDWELFRSDVKRCFKEYDSIAAVQINPHVNDGEYEKKCEEIIGEVLGIRCVKGYDLFQELNVQKRGATALLNSRLIRVMDEFFDSIDKSMKKIGMDLPIYVVKSDGSIMTKEYAMQRPVETLLSGPAASIIGAFELMGEKDAFVIDIGGTTTDIALIRNGSAANTDSGIKIGQWSTMVKGVSIDTFALGGDSAVEYKDFQLHLGQRRNIPLCMLASRFPEVKTELEELISTGGSYNYPANQFFVLTKKRTESEYFTETENKVLKILSKGPLSYRRLAESVGLSPYVFQIKRLEDEGIVMRSGVTPTDVMHIQKRYTFYDEEASLLGVSYLSRLFDEPIEKTCLRINRLICEKLYENCSQILLKHEMGSRIRQADLQGMGKIVSYFQDRHLSGLGGDFIDVKTISKYKIVGIGAPAKIMMEDLDRLFETRLRFSEYGMVANAVGAASGVVSAYYEVKLKPDVSSGELRYALYGGSKLEIFNFYGEALEEGKKTAAQRAAEKAGLQGGKRKNLDIDVRVSEQYYDPGGESRRILIETLIIAVARESMISEESDRKKF